MAQGETSRGLSGLGGGGRLVAVIAVVSAMVIVAVTIAVVACRVPDAVVPHGFASLKMLDREGRLLREDARSDSGRATWVPLSRVSPHVVAATVAVEDRRFGRHPGVDGVALMRAVRDNVVAGRVVSGASTLTMQLVRLLVPRERTMGSKVVEAVAALELHWRLGKDGVLEHYLNRAPYGNRVAGIEAASRLYFGVPSSDLSLAQAALLAGLPNAPTLLNPYRQPARAKGRMAHVLRAMVRHGAIDEAAMERALREPLRFAARAGRFFAPHFVDLVRREVDARLQTAATVRTTLDLDVQGRAEAALRERLESLTERGARTGAVVVFDNRSGAVLAMAGSRDYWDERIAGAYNAALALRQPGSTLKPFLYAFALEQGRTAASIAADVPTAFVGGDGEFHPRNYDGKFHGPVRYRVALGASLNVAATAVLAELGVGRWLTFLRRVGFLELTRQADEYGVGLALGNGEVSLLSLARGYAVLARGGTTVASQMVIEAHDATGGALNLAPRGASETVMGAATAFVVSDILADDEARAMTFGRRSVLAMPFRAAVKTGTSQAFRDNWAVGFTEAVTVAVWVGNVEDVPMQRVSGVSGAGPILRDVLTFAAERYGAGLIDATDGADGVVQGRVCALSGLLVGQECPGGVNEWFKVGGEPHEVCTWHGAETLVPEMFRVRPGVVRRVE